MCRRKSAQWNREDDPIHTGPPGRVIDMKGKENWTGDMEVNNGQRARNSNIILKVAFVLGITPALIILSLVLFPKNIPKVFKEANIMARAYAGADNGARIPLIDRNRPSKIRTATFALG